MSESGSRPRPEYGEYATPEEQRAAIKAPESNPHYASPEQAGADSHQSHPVYGTATPPTDVRTPVPPQHPGAQQHPSGQQGGPSGVPGAPAASAFLRHPVDRVISIALLVLGLYNVITAFTSRGQTADEIDQAYKGIGITGDYTATTATATVDDVTAVIFLVLWIAAAVLTTWRITSGRIAFWIPLVAGLLASVVRAVGLLILFLHDPTFLQYLQQSGG